MIIVISIILNYFQRAENKLARNQSYFARKKLNILFIRQIFITSLQTKTYLLNHEQKL